MKSGKSLSTKIILIVEAILLLSSTIFCAVSISRAQVGIRRAIQQRMVDIANCAAGSVNGDILKSLKAGDENTPEYKAVYDTMAVFRDNAELEYVYAVREEEDGRFTFILDTDPDEPASFGDEAQYTEALSRAGMGTTTVDEVPYSDAWGKFYSAYSPVFDSEGRVAGIVTVDFSVAWFDAQMQEQTDSNVKSYAIILAGTLLGAAILCLVTLRPFVRQQEQLLEEKVTAESANRAKSEFLANMSHEIRTPINAVLGMNEMILRESGQGSRTKAGQKEEDRNRFSQIRFYAKEVERAGRSLLAIINGILDFSRIEAGRMELVKVRYRLSTLLNEVSSIIQVKAQEKGLEFTVSVDEFLPDNLFGDEARVREILINILNNAAKYTEHGFIRMTVGAGGREGNNIRLVFSVEDSGVGIRQEDMDKLFTKFQRLDLERNSTVEGSGLGLVITRSLLNMMDGTIDVMSEYGKGSVFTVTIPQRIVSADPIGTFPKQFDSAGAEMSGRWDAFRAPDARILVVDDTKMNLTVTVSLLKDTEIRIDTAMSGADAIALAEENAYDMIFMDQRMPEMDGTETLHRIRELKDNPNSGIPVICLTADAIIGAKERYLAEGFSDYLAKPVDGLKLEAMLLKYLPEEKIRFAVEIGDGMAEEEPTARPGDGNGYEVLRGAGIDPDTGLYYCQGDESLYHTLLTEFVRDYPDKDREMRRNIGAGNWKNYGILVHALKSTSKMLGARELSGMAARLEKAANDGDGDTIRQEHGPMIRRYGDAVQAIQGILQVPEEESMDVLEFAPDGPEEPGP